MSSKASTAALVNDDIANRIKRKHPEIDIVAVPGVGHAPDISEPVSLAAVEQYLNLVFSA